MPSLPMRPHCTQIEQQEHLGTHSKRKKKGKRGNFSHVGGPGDERMKPLIKRLVKKVMVLMTKAELEKNCSGS